MKTHRAAAKRFKVTASGKVLRRKAGLSHLNEHKAQTLKKKLSKMVEVFKGNIAKINVSLPYKKYSR